MFCNFFNLRPFFIEYSTASRFKVHTVVSSAIERSLFFVFVSIVFLFFIVHFPFIANKRNEMKRPPFTIAILLNIRKMLWQNATCIPLLPLRIQWIRYVMSYIPCRCTLHSQTLYGSPTELIECIVNKTYNAKVQVHALWEWKQISFDEKCHTQTFPHMKRVAWHRLVVRLDWCLCL